METSSAGHLFGRGDVSPDEGGLMQLAAGCAGWQPGAATSPPRPGCRRPALPAGRGGRPFRRTSSANIPASATLINLRFHDQQNGVV